MTPLKAEEIDRGVIRLGGSSSTQGSAGDPGSGEVGPKLGSGDRRGFDYQAFGSRFESLWFHRKAYLNEGRIQEAERQAESIRSFVSEEGVRRLEAPAAALVWEANRYLREGNSNRSLTSLHLAEALDPGRPQVRLLRANVLWKSGAGPVASAREAARGLYAALRGLMVDPARLQPLLLVALVSFLCTSVFFSVLMVVRYHVPLRHEVEEWMHGAGKSAMAVPAGWAVLFLPLLTWVAAGWVFFYWIVVTYRFMKRTEKLLAMVLLLGVAGATPLYRLCIDLYGKTADPRIRTTYAAARGEYDPELIVRLRDLVDADPDDRTYRFLLAGLYKDGRFFEEAFEEYRRVLTLDPSTWQAYVNIGNLYLHLGQYGEAIAQYRRALDIRPDAVVALMNTYHAQTESFRLNEAAETLELARRLDAAKVAEVLSMARGRSGPAVRDATLDMSAVWQKMIQTQRSGESKTDGRNGNEAVRSSAAGSAGPVALFACLTLVGAVMTTIRGRTPARRCHRCGRPYCVRCKSSKEAPEYCSHCVHLFVFGEGLSSETRARKMYEIERFHGHVRTVARVASAVFPGAGDVWVGNPLRGVALCGLWIAGLLTLLPSAFYPIRRALGLEFNLSVIQIPTVPPVAHLEPAWLIGLSLLAMSWWIGNLTVWMRRKEI